MPFLKNHKYNVGRKRSKSTIEKIRQANIGRKHSEETIQKLRISHLGKKPSSETLKRMSISMSGNKNPFYGKKHSKEAVEKMKEKRKVQVITTENRKKRSESMIGKNLGPNSWNWKGGVTSPNKLSRKSIEFRVWREKVFERDNFTCQKYGIKGGKLHPHHIKNFSQYPELRFDINNGITLSEKAHREFHKIYGQQNNTLEQLQEFIKK